MAGGSDERRGEVDCRSLGCIDDAMFRVIQVARWAAKGNEDRACSLGPRCRRHSRSLRLALSPPGTDRGTPNRSKRERENPTGLGSALARFQLRIDPRRRSALAPCAAVLTAARLPEHRERETASCTTDPSMRSNATSQQRRSSESCRPPRSCGLRGIEVVRLSPRSSGTWPGRSDQRAFEESARS